MKRATSIKKRHLVEVLLVTPVVTVSVVQNTRENYVLVILRDVSDCSVDDVTKLSQGWREWSLVILLQSEVQL